MTPAHFVEVRIGVKIMTDKNVEYVLVRKDLLLSLLDRNMDLIDKAKKVDDAVLDLSTQGIVDQHGQDTPDNVVDLDERRIEKNQSDIYFE